MPKKANRKEFHTPQPPPHLAGPKLQPLAPQPSAFPPSAFSYDTLSSADDQPEGVGAAEVHNSTSFSSSPAVSRSTTPQPMDTISRSGDPVRPAARIDSPNTDSAPIAAAKSSTNVGLDAPPGKEAGHIDLSGEKIARVRVLQVNKEHNPMLYVNSEVDRIASLIGLAMMGVMPDGSKMKKHPSFYAPETPMMAAAQWTPGLSSYMPTVVAKKFVSLNRASNEDSREDLGFFDHCISHVRSLFPQESNNETDRFWRAVKMGIQALKREYRSEPLQQLPRHVAEKWGIAGWKETMTYNDMFDRWIQLVKGFYKKTDERSNTALNVAVEEYLPDEIAASLTHLLHSVAQAEKEGKNPGNTVSSLKKLVESVLATGRVPEKLHPFSERASPLWPQPLITKNIQEIEKISREREPYVQHQKIEKMIREIETVADQYAMLVQQELCEVMSL